MSKKKSKKQTSRKATPPTTNDSPATAVDYYPETERAFDALIMAYVDAEAVHRVAKAVGDELENVKRMGVHPAYVRKPDDDDSPEDQARATRLREALPSRLVRLNGLVDTYYAAERRFREHVEKAKVAVDVAAIELDSPDTPPLRRTSIAIRRALRNLSGSVPYAMTAGWAEAAESRVLEGIRTTSYRVSVWIEELRLLVRPRHTMPPPLLLMLRTPESSLRTVATSGGRRASQRASGTTTRRLSRDQRRNRAAKKGDVNELASLLTDLQLETLGALQRVGAHDRNSRRSASYLAKKMNDRDEKTLDHPMATLVALHLTESQGGRDGGSWLTTLGDAVLRARGGGQR